MAKKLLMLRGLPASGKSTYAQNFVEKRARTGEEWVIVCKDDLRLELAVKDPTWKWSPANESKDVIPLRNERIGQALRDGVNVVSSDTNFGKHEADLRFLAISCAAEFEVKEIPTPLEICLIRDFKRPEGVRVGEAVIRGMATKYNYPPPIFTKVEVEPLCMPAVICDIDGTLALHNGRNPYDCGKCIEDLVHEPVAKVIRILSRKESWQIIYISGREALWRDQTLMWMQKNDIPPGPLHMRPTGDKRTDWIVKGELFNKHVRGKYNVIFVLDDRDQVVKFWRKIGLVCFQVAEGTF